VTVEEDEGNHAHCPNCQDFSDHEILRRNNKGSGEDLLLKCLNCDNVHKLEIRPPKPIFVKTTLSDGNQSTPTEVEVDDDEIISDGDLFEHNEITWQVTRIDDMGSNPKNDLLVNNISSMWAVRCDIAIVNTTSNFGESSISSKIECEPNRRFSCGSIIEIHGKRLRIRAIHTGKGRTLSGSRLAMEIRRIYLQPP